MIDPWHHPQNSSISPGIVILLTTVVPAWHLVSIGVNNPQNMYANDWNTVVRLAMLADMSSDANSSETTDVKHPMATKRWHVAGYLALSPSYARLNIF